MSSTVIGISSLATIASRAKARVCTYASRKGFQNSGFRFDDALDTAATLKPEAEQ
jgi:hypothetical protein